MCCNFRLYCEQEDGIGGPWKSMILKAWASNNGRINYVAQENIMLLKMKNRTTSVKSILDDSNFIWNWSFRDEHSTNIVLNRSGSYRWEIVRTFFLQRPLRKEWLVQNWNFNYSDEKLLTVTLPMRRVFRAHVFAPAILSITKLKTITFTSGFCVASYFGRFSNWSEFLSLRDYLPAVSKFQFEYQKARARPSDARSVLIMILTSSI